MTNTMTTPGATKVTYSIIRVDGGERVGSLDIEQPPMRHSVYRGLASLGLISLAKPCVWYVILTGAKISVEYAGIPTFSLIPDFHTEAR